MSTADFYDDFINYQRKSGINDRIFHLYKRLLKWGLDTNTNILEIGCGIGTLTYLLSHKIKHGRIEAVDFSRKSIDFAKSHLTQNNIIFTAADILEFETDFSRFDAIVLFDVIEHIPVQDHPELFRKIGEWMNAEASLFINIPNPRYTLFELMNNSQELQEIDQPIFIEQLAEILSRFSLHIEYLETYSIWVKNDYQFVTIKKDKTFVVHTVREDQNLFQRLTVRLIREFRKLIYPYPPKYS
jgi:2-polyprenyl-3-methyl-5-hydroxy-6-metoxy-1,4-benzoquinol methylase